MRDEKLSRILAGLSYFPNIIVAAIPIAYTLITKKGGGYAKFHALQGIVFLILRFVIGVAVAVAMLILALALSKDLQLAGIVAIAAPVFALAVWVVVCIISAIVGLAVGFGKDIRLPIIASFLDRFV